MPATYSSEGRIQAALLKLDCSGRNFVALVNSLGIAVSYSYFAAKINGTLNAQIAQTLQEISDRMLDLQDSTVIPIDWAKTERVATALTLRLVANITAEMNGRRSVDLDQSATGVTANLR